MSIPKFELDKKTPLDVKTAISYFGSEDTYFRLLVQYEEISFLKDLEGCAKAIDEKDYHEVKERIHSIKGASAYAGASRVTDHWYWMQLHYMEGETQKMMDRYPEFIESVVEFRVYYRKVIDEKEGKEYKINPEHETCPIAKGYKIIKIADYKYKWEKEPEEIDHSEIEQLDKESVKESDAEQANEKEYIKSQKEEQEKQEEPDRPSNNQINELEQQRPPKGVSAASPNNDFKPEFVIEEANQNDFQNEMIDLDIEKRSEQSETAGRHQKNVGSNLTKQDLKAEPKAELKPESKGGMKRDGNFGSHSILQIESDSVKPSGMCGCSKCIIF